MDYAIQTEGLVRSFGNFRAVDGLDVIVQPGTFFGFLGPNGAGKSTTIKMLTGLLRISGGTARVLGINIEQDPVAVKRNIGVVPEELALFDRLTGAEYLRFVGRMYGLESSVIHQRTDELLDLMDLERDREKLIVDYSHGMKKKISFVAALIHEPKLLFLDEPFEGIDAISSQQIKIILEQLVRSGVTVFLTSHILEIVERLCTHIAIINHGKLAAQGSLEELRYLVDSSSSEGRLEALFLKLVGDDKESKGLSWLA